MFWFMTNLNIKRVRLYLFLLQLWTPFKICAKGCLQFGRIHDSYLNKKVKLTMHSVYTNFCRFNMLESEVSKRLQGFADPYWLWLQHVQKLQKTESSGRPQIVKSHSEQKHHMCFNYRFTFLCYISFCPLFISYELT